MDTKKMLQYENSKKSIVVTYLLYICFGWCLQLHRFYGGNKLVAFIFLFLPVFSFFLFSSNPDSRMAWIVFSVWGMIGVFDLFYIPFMVKNKNNRILNQYFKEENS